MKYNALQEKKSSIILNAKNTYLWTELFFLV